MDDRESPGHHKPGDRFVYRHKRRGAENKKGKPLPLAGAEARGEGPRTGASTEPLRAVVHKPGDRIVRFLDLRGARLRRVIGVTGLFSTGYGNVGSSIYYALGVTTLFALGAAPLALAIAGIFFIFTVLTYTEATVAVPEAGGASSFSRRGLGEVPSFFAGWVTLLSFTITVSISAFTAGSYLSVFFPILAQAPYNIIFAVVAIALLMVLNIVGVQEAANFSVVFAVIDLATQIVLVIVGGIFLLNLPLLIGQINFGVAPTWPNFILGTAVAMVAYTGIETISNMAEEAKSPSRSIPRAYGGLIFAVLVLFVGISLVALSAMPVVEVDGQYTTELVTRYMDDPVAGIAHKLPEPYSSVLTPMVGMLASSILLIGANAGIIGVSRLSFSMGQHRQLPQFWYRLHPKFRTPYVSIIFFCVVAALLAASGSIPQMSEAYVFAATVIFTMAHVALIGMRVREPGSPRPFKLPFNLPIKGREIPLTAVVGGTGTFAVLLMVLVNYPFGRWIGLGWLLAGLILYVAYRRHLGIPLNQTVTAKKGWVMEHADHEEPASGL